MKKPVILLVDDDPSVLEALEAALDPVFGEIARVETFADPKEVLAEIRRWAAEERSIAVAIVDQKMPGMTGVELLGRLRQEEAPPPRSILLTGYAGLESALTAKNAAGADRFREKPWHADDLVADVRRLFWKFLKDSEMDRYLLFREIVDRSELEEFLSLRFNVYRNEPGIEHLLPSGGPALDVDAYDRLARFFGLFLEGSSSRLVGTLRVVGQEEGPAADSLRELSVSVPGLADRLNEPCLEPLPLMEYLIDVEAVRRLFRRLVERGERVVEPSRLTLHPDFRAGRPALRMIEAIIAFYYFFLGFENGLLTICVPGHAAFYRPYGFREAEGTQTRFHPDLDVNVTCLHGPLSGIPASRRPRLQSLTERINRTAATCSCSTFPACLAGPYETGEFRGSEHFCPLAAIEFLSSPETRAPLPCSNQQN